MPTYLEVDSLTLDIPVFNVSRSFRTTLLQRFTGGEIEQNKNSKQISIRALQNINFRLNAGDRLGLVGHNGGNKD